MEGLSLVALQAACPRPVDCRRCSDMFWCLQGRACGLNAAGDTADLTARLAVHAACEAAVRKAQGRSSITPLQEPLGPEEAVGSFISLTNTDCGCILLQGARTVAGTANCRSTHRRLIRGRD